MTLLGDEWACPKALPSQESHCSLCPLEHEPQHGLAFSFLFCA